MRVEKLDFKKIPVVLKRYDFNSKMAICQKHSMDIMSVNGLINFNEQINKIFPWELETFALFSVITLNEYSYNKFENGKNIKEFHNVINTIRNYTPPELEVHKENVDFVSNILMITALNQFQLQEDIRFKLYRYLYIFKFKNDVVDMNTQFISKFGTGYKEFKELGVIFQILASSNLKKYPEYKSILDYTINKYELVIRQLSIERTEFIARQKNVTKDINQYVYGFKFFYQFPFIKNGDSIFLPLPHLIMQAVTSSLLFRLTEGNGELRELLGKEVLESYIHHIASLCDGFNEVLPEYKYIHGQNEKRTLDIMIREGDSCLLLDSKSMSPRASLRNLIDEETEYTINRIVENVIQVYTHITQRFQVEYNPFEGEMCFVKGNIFGAVILLEDSYVRREIIMKRAAEKMGIDIKSKEYEYLCSNVKIISLYVLEEMIFTKENILQLLKNNRYDKEKWFDFSFTSSSKSKKMEMHESIRKMSKGIEEFASEFAEELVRARIIGKEN